MEREILPGIQTACPGIYRKELVCLDGIPTKEVGGISYRMDELLRNFGVLSANPGNRRMDPSPDSDVLLETVALSPD